MVAGHGELRMLLLDDKIVQVLLKRKLVTESQPVVEQAETDQDIPLLSLLVERDGQFIVMIADLFFLAPDGLPGLVECAGFAFLDRKATH